ncbi:unnamed protein product [Lactuca saligna]|uniref:Uncharacterized protein n=1 Tax=Lactuca saligna TaxID=75948 RepID=A0AA35V846_LACSI|nr:unnamed protein product [Lactuca saligna]
MQIVANTGHMEGLLEGLEIAVKLLSKTSCQGLDEFKISYFGMAGSFGGNETQAKNTNNDQQVFKKEIFVIKHQINHELKRHDDEDDPNALNPSSTTSDTQSQSSGGAGVIPTDLKTLIAEEDTIVLRGASIPIWTPV